ncbi:MAG TPA: two-component system activity regulator YycH [Bacilli bacterium]|nr:two-component system activity regulator YycH [Bacilli bacterium]
MREQLKTLALTALVTISLLLSLGIWSITPQYEALDTVEFDNNASPVNPSLQRSLRNVTEPRAIVAHVGEDKHTAVFPGQSLYDTALHVLREASFFDLQITSDFDNDAWQTLVKKGPSIQFEFDTRLSGQMMEDAELLQFTSRVDPVMQCQTLYLYKTSEDSDLRAVFYDAIEDRAYLARAVLPKERYAYLLGAASEAVKTNPYAMYGHGLNRNFFLPAGKSKVTQYNYDAVAQPAEQIERLVDSFFFDKSLTRRVEERDGSQIFTDGSRLVRISQPERVIEYRNIGLSTSVAPAPEPDIGPAKVLAFANDHGGFSGHVLLHERAAGDRAPSQAGTSSNDRFEFRQYVDGVPLIGQMTSVYTGMTGNEVTTMQRSRYTLAPKPFSTAVKEVIAGPDVIKAVEHFPLLKLNKISDVYLAYLVEESALTPRVTLRPVWVLIQAEDNRSGLLDAVTGEPLRGEEGALLGLE